MGTMRALKSGLILLALVVVSSAFATSWFTNGPKRDIATLVITGNYKSPRLMAELILYESRQPYLLLPTPQSQDQRIIYVQPKGAAREIPEKSLPQFVQFLNPRRIVLLGDERYVPERYAKLIDRSIPVIRIEGADWERIADETTLMLGLSNLGTDYKRVRKDLDSRLRPTERTRLPQEELKPVSKPVDATDDLAAGEIEVVEVDTVQEAAPVEPAE